MRSDGQLPRTRDDFKSLTLIILETYTYLHVKLLSYNPKTCVFSGVVLYTVL